MQKRELCSGSVLQERAAGASSLVCTDLKHASLCYEKVRKSSNRECYTRQSLVQFANCLVHAQQNYETNYSIVPVNSVKSY